MVIVALFEKIYDGEPIRTIFSVSCVELWRSPTLMLCLETISIRIQITETPFAERF
jgi:hypothetical protein